MIHITIAQAKTILALLGKASDEFGNHGCNDFDLIADAKLTGDEAAGIVATIRATAPGSAPLLSRHQHDWVLMDVMAAMLRRQLRDAGAEV